MLDEYFGEKMVDSPPAFKNAFLAQHAEDGTFDLRADVVNSLRFEYSLDDHEFMGARIAGLGLARRQIEGLDTSAKEFDGVLHD